MSNAEANQQYAEERRFFPELPTGNQWTAETVRASTSGLHAIAVTDKVGNGLIAPDLGRRVLRAYLDTIFTTYNLYGQHSLGDSLRPWIEVIDDHQRRLSRAEQEGPNRGGGAPNPAGTQNAPPRQPTPPAQNDRQPTPGPNLGQQGREPDNNQHIPPPRGAGVHNPDAGRGTVEEEEDTGGEVRNNNRRGRDSPSDDEETERGAMVLHRSKRSRKDFDDDDDDDAPQNKADFGWAAESFINHAVMSDRHREVLSRIKNYKKNIYGAVETREY
ncbi:hypothetical protein F5880DRAFT_1616757 [Lentinula raphanica]|nr:hypothetical protein F5880DRAFT_1616757 [Lentinula raphanica]